MIGKSGLGEFWDNWIEETEQEKQKPQELIEKRKQEAKAKEEEYYMTEKNRIEEMQKRYNFSIGEEPIRIALERLEKLKVNEYRYVDYHAQTSFDDVWRSVLHEVDLYEEGEESPLNKTTCKGAKNWLKSFSHLYKGRVPEEYKE